MSKESFMAKYGSAEQLHKMISKGDLAMYTHGPRMIRNPHFGVTHIEAAMKGTTPARWAAARHFPITPKEIDHLMKDHRAVDIAGISKMTLKPY